MDDFDDTIRRRALWVDDEDEPPEFRSAIIDRWGENIIRGLEDMFLDAPERGSGPRTPAADIQTAEDVPLLARGDLETFVSSGRLGYRGQKYRIHEPGSAECDDPALTGPPDIPMNARPDNWYDEAAWYDACLPIEDYIRLQVTPFTNPPMKALAIGLSPSSVERVREGIQAGDEIPRGSVEMERRRVSRAGTFLAPTDQEGRNRGVASWLEGESHALCRLIAVPG